MELFSYLLAKNNAGESANLQSKTETITTNTTTTFTPDEGYDGLSSVEVTTNVSSSGADEYFNIEPATMSSADSWASSNYVKKMSTLTIPNSVTSLQNLFKNYNLNKVPKVICGSNVTNMKCMYCPIGNVYTNESNYNAKITEIDVSGLDVSRVGDMTGMFATLSNLTSLDLSNWSMSGNKGVDLYSMFRKCSSLTSLDVSNIHVKFTGSFSAQYMFENCSNLTSLTLGNNFIDCTGQTSSFQQTFNYMFSGCSKLTSLDLSGIKTSSYALSSLNYMFSGCSKLTTIVFGNNFVTNAVTSMSNLFNGCSSLTTIDARALSFTRVTTRTNMLNNVPTTCLIIVADQTQKDWFTTNFSTYTNVQTVAEYEGS